MALTKKKKTEKGTEMEVSMDRVQMPTGHANGRYRERKLWLKSKDPSTPHLHTH